MPGNINKVMLIGDLGSDPEIHATQAGERVVSFDVATSKSWRDRASGERRERTEWHHIAVFDERIGEFVERYLRNGSKVYVEGMLQTRDWEDRDGQPRRTVEVVLSRHRGELVLLASPREVHAGGAGAPSGVDDGLPF